MVIVLEEIEPNKKRYCLCKCKYGGFESPPDCKYFKTVFAESVEDALLSEGFLGIEGGIAIYEYWGEMPYKWISAQEC